MIIFAVGMIAVTILLFASFNIIYTVLFKFLWPLSKVMIIVVILLVLNQYTHMA